MKYAQPLRWGIAGLGRHGTVVAEAIRRSGHFLYACVGSTLEKTKRFATEHGVHRVAESYNHLVDDPCVDAVWIATPNHLHAKMAVDALRAGKHVLCEKPLALTVREARDVVSVSSRTGSLLRVGFHLRCHPVLLKVKSILDRGDLGIPLEADWQRVSAYGPDSLQAWRRDLSQSGAGVLNDVGTHLIDGLRWLLRTEVRSVFALSKPPRLVGVPDHHTMLSLELGTGTLACVRCSRLLSGGINALEIWGSEGGLQTSALRWSDQYWVKVWTRQSQVLCPVSPADPYVNEIESFAREIEGESTDLAAPLDGLRAVEVVEAAQRSLMSGCAVRLDFTMPGPASPGTGMPGSPGI
jgi:predicted dehydrogenase